MKEDLRSQLAMLPLSEEQIDKLIKHQEAYESRFIVCNRCKQRTNNTTQGHYWSLCKVTHTLRDFHFCCPGDCQLGNDDEKDTI